MCINTGKICITLTLIILPCKQHQSQFINNAAHSFSQNVAPNKNKTKTKNNLNEQSLNVP